ncbi:glycosyltransferase family 2 protein [Spiribacter halobius]|uniref:Glycosyl transferase n=1 Tax=Sediminicurvatus halobius TaxID=2182432 RepID=A0A2U2N1M1_9GAMM|nr:glycosyltransferase family 2 protein [Spiribacter halobius]PWG62948.1 glycosyl transferase [Spiribacter halobius]UEX77459.1 glycosyltransferase [Spiribacter halobius]
MKISVITATYNSAQRIDGALDSLAEQTMQNVEHVVIDGGSTDGTVRRVGSAKRVPEIVVSEPDRGIYDALNKGLALATGDVVGFLHSDDRYADEHVLERVMAEFVATDCDAVYGDLEYVAHGPEARVIRYWKGRPYSPRLLRRGWMPAHPTFFMKRRLYEKLGGFDVSYRIAGDYESMLRYFLAGIDTRYVPHVLVRMRLGGASNGSVAGVLRKMAEDYRAIRHYGVGGAVTLMYKNLSKASQFFRGRHG